MIGYEDGNGNIVWISGEEEIRFRMKTDGVSRTQALESQRMSEGHSGHACPRERKPGEPLPPKVQRWYDEQARKKAKEAAESADSVAAGKLGTAI